jgi:superfamily II DNA or RNA helicase
MFKTGLLSRVLADLKKIECEPDIEYIGDNSKEELNDPTIEGFTFRDYQDELINLALTEKRGVIKSPTGSGKTLIMAGLVQALRGRKMVLLFNAKQLLKQSYEFLTKSCGIENVGLNFGEGYLHGDIMLSTVQSIDKILETHLEEAEVIMVDECHEFASGKTTLAAIRSFPKATYRIGFTATPPSDPIPQHNLEGALGRVLSVVDTASLVDKGTLAKPVIQMINRSYNASGQDEDMGYIDVYENYIVNNDLRNKVIREIVEDIRNKNDKARVLILVKSLEHGRILQDLLGSSEFLEGANDLGERYRIISNFIQSENSSVLIGTKILQTGINIEQITHFINARGMKSEIATLQALGRALRTHESKKEAFVYDFLDKEKYLKDHSTSRKKHYENEGHTVNVL